MNFFYILSKNLKSQILQKLSNNKDEYMNM